MKEKDDLFLLIHSLKKHEKRFFKLSASTQQGDTLYMRIYDLIASQKEYDEDMVREKMDLNKNIFAYKKNYLFNLILEKMAVLHSDPRAELRRILTQADFLFERALYSQQSKILSKAKKIAQELDLTSYQHEILNMELTLARKRKDLDLSLRVMEEDKVIISKLALEGEYQKLKNEIIVKIQKTGAPHNEKDKKELEDLVNHPLMRDEKHAKTFRCRNWMCHALSLYYAVTGNVQKEYYYAKKNINLFLADPKIVEQNLPDYLFGLYLIIGACNSMKKYEEAKHYIDLLEEVSHRSAEGDKLWVFFNYYDSCMVYFTNTGKFKEGIPVAQKLEGELHEFEGKLNTFQNIILRYCLANFYFYGDDWSNCIRWLNKIRNEEEALRIRPDLESAIKILYLLAHYEKGNLELVHNLSLSVHRFLSTKQRLYKFEGILLKFLKKDIFKVSLQKEKVALFKQLHKEFLPLAKDPEENEPFREFDYISWLESKIENRPFAEVVREKAEKLQ